MLIYYVVINKNKKLRKDIRYLILIKTRKQLKEVLTYERKLYPNHFFDYLICYQRIYNWKFIKYLRYAEYHKNNNGIVHKILYLYYSRRKNRLGSRIGVEIWENTFGEGLLIHHNGNIVINGESRIGKNCELHGDNCIGNAYAGSGMPVIGNNVDIGVGAKIIGNVTIADGIKIGANAVVNKSFYEEGITIVGVPARKVIKS